MERKIMTAKKSLPTDPDLIGADAALKRAAKAAHTLARKTNTPCYIWKDGQIVDLMKQGRRGTKREEITVTISESP
jgi:hypothetical protein